VHLPPPGWYTDPSGTFAWRWWDGSSWTPHTAPHAPAPVASWRAQAPPVDEAALVGAERHLVPWAYAGIIAYTAAAAGDVALRIAYRAQLADWGHEVRTEFFAALHNTNNTTVHAQLPGAYSAGIWLLVVVQGLAAVGICLWQYRAARVAALVRHYPAKRSPGLGVGSWFIPFVNLCSPTRRCATASHPAPGSGGSSS
jgi:hypothetical protein